LNSKEFNMALYEVTDTRSGERFLTEQQGPRKALDRVLDGRFTTRTIMTPIEAIAAMKGAIMLDDQDSAGGLSLPVTPAGQGGREGDTLPPETTQDETLSPASDAIIQADAGTAGTGEGGISDPVSAEGEV
jgi:hypothetical protein